MIELIYDGSTISLLKKLIISIFSFDKEEEN